MQSLLRSFSCFLLLSNARSAVMPPPWADPTSNPCAAQPRGWQLLYWPADGKCYKIFQIGAPCPETMELAPAADGGGTIAECRCPPGTAQSPRDARCHEIFTTASCPEGQYFAPVPAAPGKPRWGVCRKQERCAKEGEVFWLRDGKCYQLLSRGPCPKGELLILGKDGLAVCSCSKTGHLGRYYWPGNRAGCYEHYTKGPCTEHGEIFLPGGKCGCQSDLPHYYEPTGMCYQLGGIGPCPPGHYFIVTADNNSYNETIRAQCICKANHALYEDGSCYRIFTRGPCKNGYMLTNSTTCVPVPCKRGRLYFAQEKTCYKIGTRGPCSNGQVVLYDYNARLSVDGISYNGVCGCTDVMKNSGKCSEEYHVDCEDTPGMVLINQTCHKLYTQGPCKDGEWLVARRFSKRLWQEDETIPKAKCECRPGYKRIVEDSEIAETESNNLLLSRGCQPPAVVLANFLNHKLAPISA